MAKPKDFKDLPPEERIKKLKQLEKERQKEIAEAEKLIKASEDEITDKAEFKEKVPIPQFSQEDLVGLGEGGREILKQRGVLLNVESDESEDTEENKTESLEESVEAEAPKFDKPVDVQYALPGESSRHEINSEYLMQQSHIPLQQLRTEMDSIYKKVEDRGYMTWGEQSRANVVYSAIDEKLRAVDAGNYSMTEDIAKQAGLAKTLTGRLLDRAYQSNTIDQKNWYK